MIPAYSQNRISSAFFLIYLIFGLFLLMNLLLAIFYNNFKKRVDNVLEIHDEQRAKFFTEQFLLFDKENKGYLNKE